MGKRSKGVSGLFGGSGSSHPGIMPINPIATMTTGAAAALGSFFGGNSGGSTPSLQQIADRKIEGQRYIANPVTWTTWTPSAANKCYQYTSSITYPMTDGTYFALSEGQNIVKVDHQGSYFEAYSAQKFTVLMTVFSLDKDNAQAASEVAWANGDPRDLLLSHHVDVQRIGKTRILPARPIDSSKWYSRIGLSAVYDKVIREYIRENGPLRAVSKLPFEPHQTFVEFVIVASTTDNIYYYIRRNMNAILAQSDL